MYDDRILTSSCEPSMQKMRAESIFK